MHPRLGSFAWIAFSLLAALVDAAPSELESDKSAIPGERRLIELYRDYHDCVVKVKFAVKTIDDAGKEQVALTVQSGFYIDAEGTVLTNSVPTQKGPRLRIEKDGLQLLAVPIASDSRTNIAILQVAKPPPGIRFINLTPSDDEPPIGSLAYAITSPLDLSPTPKLGIVTGRESSFSNIEFPCTYTRIGISSGPAEGGAPVFASDGTLMGVSVASLPDVDSSYIVPTRSLQHIVTQLRENKKVFHPRVNAEIQERANPNSQERSLVVDSVGENSTASQIGLLPGDRILGVEGNEISGINEWRDALFFSEEDQFIRLTIQRAEKEREIALLLSSK
ncbi:S1C family serine protease [Pelagicoccus sp. SDUM812002]|uniref:S1C family serine protease n=1 Tax=Pelagicoccus sp. SDUM812002 TaxID=3041266 RepID=UPI00280FB08A|nr:S1C family serine protease [Pelagicoccus sp. SDUM812002]MDQ8186098.1 S1C family serine protease [Pelagicoccus sp. SDUM812002]